MGPALEERAARILASAESGKPADRALREHLLTARGLEQGERRAVARAVFAAIRWSGWMESLRNGRERIAAALELQGRFDRDPRLFKDQALAARAVPGWLREEMEVTPAFLRSLQREPALWIRPRLGLTEAVSASLRNTSHPSLPASIIAPAGLTALRYDGSDDLFSTEGFRAGSFEIQDLASQLVGHACAPGEGSTWWDACSGEGGKTLHLCDLLRGKGLVWASDRSVRRLDVLRRRAARAGAYNYRVEPWTSAVSAPVRKPCDGVLVDAPCSGVGTWGRNPHARWTTGPKDVAELAEVQLRLLGAAARLVKIGGRLVYSVCTLTRRETTAVAAAFRQSHPGFEPAPLPISALGHCELFLLPEEIGANGMYVAAWTRVR